MKTFTFLLFFFSFILFTNAQSTEYALGFDGTNDYVSIPHQAFWNIDKVTIEMWFYWEESVGTDVDFLIGKAVEQFEIHTGGGSGNFGLRFIPTTGVYLDTEPDIFSQNTWNHIAFIFDPSLSINKCYLNGVEKTLTNRGSRPVTDPIVSTPNEIKLGKRGDLSFSFKGKIDEVRVWNKVRTQGEITDNIYSTLTGSESGLIAYYMMSDGSGTSLSDNSSNNNPGTLINGVSWINSDLPLPVELNSFTVSVSGNTVTLNWQTATEVNNYGFEVERSTVKGEWLKVGFIAGVGNSNSPKSYSLTDNLTLTPTLSYRLKQIDLDGSFTYSKEISVDAASLPTEFALEQNYPNPFNPSTMIKYSIPVTLSPVTVSLKVFNLLGQEIVTLVNTQQPAGNYEVKFDASNLPAGRHGLASGIYLYKLQAGDFSSVKKLILMK